MKISDFPEDIEPRVGDIIEIEQGDVCFEVRIIGITEDGYLCEQDNIQGAVLLEGTGLNEEDATDIEDFLRSGGKIQQLPYKNTRKEKSAHYRLASRHIGGSGHEQAKGKLAGLRGRAAAVNVSGTGKAVVGEEKVRLDPKCWDGYKKQGTKMKGGVRVNNCVPEGQQEVAESTEQSLQKKIQAKRDALGLAREQRRARGQHQQGQREIKLQAEIDKLSSQLTQMKKQDVAEAGPFSYGYKKPRRGSVAYWAEKKRKEQEKGKPPIEPKDQMVGVAKVTKGVAEGYTGRETKDGTWRVFKDGQAVAVAGPFNSRDEAHAWIKKHKQGVSEAKSLKKRVRVVQGEHAGKTGWIREIKHGVHSTAPKRYYVDIDGGGQADNLPASALRLMKDQSDSQKGMVEGEQALNEYSFAEKQTYMKFLAAKVQKYGPQSLKPEERAELIAYLQAQKMAKENAGSSDDNQFSLSGKMPATDRIPQDSVGSQSQQQGMDYKMKQQTINHILNLRPEFERSDLELATTPELIQMLRDIQSGKMTEAEYQGRKVALGKPMAGDVKKSKVYVRKPNGKVVKVNFGDKTMKIKKSNPKRRKSFRARHNCENPGPRWKARYWSCRAW